MKQGRLTIAYNTLLKLYRIEGIPFQISCKLFMLKKKLQPYYELQAEKQDVIMEAHGVDNARNLTPEILKEFEEILKTDVEWNEEPVGIALTPDLVEKMGITGAVIDQLDGFVTFTEG